MFDPVPRFRLIMSLQVTVEKVGQKLILRLVGRIDAGNAQKAEADLFLHLKPESRLALDFSQVNFVSSAGLRIFLMMAKKSKALKGALALFALPPVVKEVFEISGFSKILTIKPSQEEAIQALG
jgi:stage II sporulation protein AA (anti-sigma F factor antagonist)